jgi:hypothetical protein
VRVAVTKQTQANQSRASRAGAVQGEKQRAQVGEVLEREDLVEAALEVVVGDGPAGKVMHRYASAGGGGPGAEQRRRQRVLSAKGPTRNAHVRMLLLSAHQGYAGVRAQAKPGPPNKGPHPSLKLTLGVYGMVWVCVVPLLTPVPQPL